MTRISRGTRTLAVALITAALAAAPALAEPLRSGPSTKGCPVEDEHGNVSWVSVGTVIGLFHCGSDGEWHFGWAVTDRSVMPPTAP